MVIIPNIIIPVIIIDTIANTIIAHVFLGRFVFLANSLIAGSTRSEMINAIKKGI